MKRTKIAGRVPLECCNGSMMRQDPERWKFRLIRFICGKVSPFLFDTLDFRSVFRFYVCWFWCCLMLLGTRKDPEEDPPFPQAFHRVTFDIIRATCGSGMGSVWNLGSPVQNIREG